MLNSFLELSFSTKLEYKPITECVWHFGYSAISLCVSNIGGGDRISEERRVIHVIHLQPGKIKSLHRTTLDQLLFFLDPSFNTYIWRCQPSYWPGHQMLLNLRYMGEGIIGWGILTYAHMARQMCLSPSLILYLDLKVSKLPSHSKWEIGIEEIIDLRPHGRPVRDWETAGGWKLCWSQDKKATSPPPSFNIT